MRPAADVPAPARAAELSDEAPAARGLADRPDTPAAGISCRSFDYYAPVARTQCVIGLTVFAVSISSIADRWSRSPDARCARRNSSCCPVKKEFAAAGIRIAERVRAHAGINASARAAAQASRCGELRHQVVEAHARLEWFERRSHRRSDRWARAQRDPREAGDSALLH